MQTFTTKKAATAYATAMGWTGADAGRAFEGLTLPIDELTLLNVMVRFAGPELLNRQRLQGAQKGQVTKKNNEIKAIEQQHAQVIQDYEQQIQSDRSAFISVIKAVYGVAQAFGYKDPWAESLISAYDKYVSDDAPDQKAA